MSSVSLELKDVSKYYVSGRSVTAALKGVSLSFHTGEFVAITGESGSGKTTMANILGGILPFESGQLYWCGETTEQYDEEDWEDYRRDNVSFIAQNYGILPGNTVMDNVVSALKLAGWEMKPAKAEAKKLLLQVELWKKRRRRAARLSSGQKQRLAIARALAKGAPILLADEPTGNLDPENSKKVIQLLAEAARDRLVIMITHDFKMAQEYVTRRVSIHDGYVRGDVVLREDYLADEPAAEGEPRTEKTVQRMQKAEQTEDSQPEADRRKKKKESPLLGWYIARIQMRARPAWTGFMALFFALTAFAVFAFMGTFIVSLDDTSTRNYDNSAFMNGEKTRLVLKKPDGSGFDESDYEKLLSVEWVESLERHDASLDVNYYYQRDVDYDIRYWLEATMTTTEIHEDVIFLEHNHFIRTIPLLKDGQVFLKAGKLPEHFDEVVAAGDESLIGTEITVHFLNRKTWGESDYLTYTMKVVGVTNYGDGLYFDERIGEVFYRCIYRDRWVIGVDRELTGNQMKISENWNQFLPSPFTSITDLDNPDETVELSQGGVFSSKNSYYVKVSEEMFDQLAYEGNYPQVSVFLKDYSYTDRTIEKLTSMGYEAISPYRVSSVNIDMEKAAERLTTLVICMVALIVSVAAQIAVLTAMFGLEMKNFAQLSDLGLACKTGKQSILWQVLLLTAIGQAVVFVIVGVALANMDRLGEVSGVLGNISNDLSVSSGTGGILDGSGTSVGMTNPAISFTPPVTTTSKVEKTILSWLYSGVLKLHNIVKYLDIVHIVEICATHLAASLLVAVSACKSLRKLVFSYIKQNTDVDLIELETKEVER